MQCGKAHFTTDNKHFTIIDAPGHKSFVPNMISGAAQADVGVLVISARKGEFETGFDRGGQTREHAMLAKTAGVKQLVIAINKMDDSTVNWDEARFVECREKLLPFLKQVGFNPKTGAFIFVLGVVPMVNEKNVFIVVRCIALTCSFRTDIYFLPVSGLTGANLLHKVSADVCTFYS